MKNNNQIITRISEFFKTFCALLIFGTKTLWIMWTTDMKKEAQTYRQEREQQKKRARNEEKKSRQTR